MHPNERLYEDEEMLELQGKSKRCGHAGETERQCETNRLRKLQKLSAGKRKCVFGWEYLFMCYDRDSEVLCAPHTAV